jgi:hypothetical protein
MERCEIGPCQLMIDKSSPPIIENLKNSMDLKSKLSVPAFKAYGGSPETAALNCTAIQLNNPVA